MTSRQKTFILLGISFVVLILIISLFQFNDFLGTQVFDPERDTLITENLTIGIPNDSAIGSSTGQISWKDPLDNSILALSNEITVNVVSPSPLPPNVSPSPTPSPAVSPTTTPSPSPIPGQVYVSIENAEEVVEGNPPDRILAIFTVFLHDVNANSTTTDQDVQVSLSLVDGSAFKDLDYFLPESSTVTISAGSTKATWRVPIKSDLISELPITKEVFFAQILSARGAELGDTVATGNIIDDDEVAPTPSVSPTPTLTPTTSPAPPPISIVADIDVDQLIYNAKPGDTITIPFTTTIRGTSIIQNIIARALLNIRNASENLQRFNPIIR